MRTTHDEVDLEVVVTEVGLVAERIRSITLRRRDDGPLPAWSPGAHVDLMLGSASGGELVRQYSLCGDPQRTDEWTVIVLLEDESRGGSAYVHSALGVGSELRARGPRNHYPLVEAPAYLFIAGGVGIAPLLPMVVDVESRGLPWRLVYGGRSRASMAFADDLVDRYGEKVELVPEDEKGPLHIPGLVQGLRHGGTAIYCCGPEGLVSAIEKMHARTRRGTLHVERFSPKGQDAPQSVDVFEVEAARSGTLVSVEPGTSILDALESAGLRVLSSCREGICGTCELFVIEGAPEHRDSILTEAERQASETMFICVSRSLSPRLVLDV